MIFWPTKMWVAKKQLPWKDLHLGKELNMLTDIPKKQYQGLNKFFKADKKTRNNKN